MTQTDIALAIALELIRKSGVREFTDPDLRVAIASSAVEMANLIWLGTEGIYMALPDSLLMVVGSTPIAFYSASFSPTASADIRAGLSATQVAITMAGVANAAARQSAKGDLTANRAEVFDVHATIEFAATPTAGNVVEFWWNPSPSATAANANVGGCSGSDAAYAGYSSNLDASIKQLQYIGSFVCTAQATTTIQTGRVGSFRPRHRYGSLVVYNRSGAAIHSDDQEFCVLFAPQLPQVQD